MDEKYKHLIANNIFNNCEKNIHFEALKCQAIIERTIIFRKIKDGSFKVKDLDNNDNNIDEEIIRAIDETKNMILMVNNNPIMAFYHISCGGNTDNSENVLNTKVDYLRRVTCDECGNNKTFSNIVDISVEDIARKFNAIINFDFLQNFNMENVIKIISRNESKRVEDITVFNKEVSGLDFAKSLNLDSPRFGFMPKEIRFFIKGVGHGLGLCQYGANEKAKNGWKSEDILKYYYTNVTISKVDEFNSKLPLKGKVFFVDAGHGGKEAGIVTKDEINEKDITLLLALELEAVLKEHGATVYMTRKEDVFLSLDDRAKIIKEIKPNFLISLHLNESKFEDINGAEGIYYWGDTEGKILGEEILKNLKEETNTKNRGIREGKVYLLKECTGSGIYLEFGYLSSTLDKCNLQNKAHVNRMAKAINNGILRYYSNKILT